MSSPPTTPTRTSSRRDESGITAGLPLGSLVRLGFLGLFRGSLDLRRHDTAGLGVDLYFDDIRRLRIRYVERPDQLAVFALQVRALNSPARNSCQRGRASV